MTAQCVFSNSSTFYCNLHFHSFQFLHDYYSLGDIVGGVSFFSLNSDSKLL